MLTATQSPRTSWSWLFFRACLAIAVSAAVAVALVYAFAGDAFHIPSGSMAPALRGHHRVCPCPRCGQEVVVGRAASDTTGSGESRFYRKASCPNCGLAPLPLSDIGEARGDQVIVNRSAYRLRSPSRWEIVVFRLLGTFYIKRLLGLPGEVIAIHDGDLYVNGRLCRKTFADVRRMRIVMFEQAKAPKGVGWRDRWESRGLAQSGEECLFLDGRRSGHTLTYRNYLLDEQKCQPIRDEYAYNGGLRADAECVHDFSMEADIAVGAGRGALCLRLCDGHDWVEVTLPVGVRQRVEAFSWPIASAEATRKLAESDGKLSLQPGRRYRVEVAFVDRRLSVAIDDVVHLSVDLPEAKDRLGVDRPFQAHADGITATLHGFRLFRDVHYGQQGTNAVRGASVRLGSDQYFMLGDNSPQSEDSRYWPDDGRVAFGDLIGPVTSVRARR